MNASNLNQLSKVINARGTFTPLGVSKSSSNTCKAVADALSQFFIIDELQDLASQTLSDFTGQEAATITHCTASAITVSVAATMTGTSKELIAKLPDTKGLAHHVIIPAPHCVNYGQSILQAIRLSGATPVVAGESNQCTCRDIEKEILKYNACCLLLVSSKLTKDQTFDFKAAIELAHKHQLVVIIDGAAQDFRIDELCNSNADLILLSGQKYLASPTAGLVLGRKTLIDSVRAQESGIGRAMKATKESIVGVLAAIDERKALSLTDWKNSQDQKINKFITSCNLMKGITATAEPDPTGLPFSRAKINYQSDQKVIDAHFIAAQLQAGNPSIWVIDQYADNGELGFELVQVSDDELDIILDKLSTILEQVTH